MELKISHPSSSFVGKQITAMVRVSERLVVLELADGSQVRFTAKEDGTLEVGGHVEPSH